MKTGSLFSGAGGMDLGFERAGFRVLWQCESDRQCREVLAEHWPEAERYSDVRSLPCEELESVDLIIGGDPCPSRSKFTVRSGSVSKSPDLSGYFLSVVGRCRPRWVVRENVCAPDAVHFAIGLELLGYRTVAFELDSVDFTAQSRRRQFIIGCPPRQAGGLRESLSLASSVERDDESPGKTFPHASCLSTYSARNSMDDNYVFVPGRGVRALGVNEIEALQGFPSDWTGSFPKTPRWRLVGNAVTVDVAQWIGERIKEQRRSDHSKDSRSEYPVGRAGSYDSE